MRTYLSIDLDYWEDQEARILGLRRLLGKLSGRTPLLFVHEHDMLLPHINQHPAQMLVNVDYHSDFDPAECVINIATWSSRKWIHWGEYREFRWYHPHPRKRVMETMCGRTDDCSVQRFNDLRKLEEPGWDKCTEYHGLPDMRKLEVVAVGVAMSSDYWIDDLESLDGQPAYRFLRPFGIPLDIVDRGTLSAGELSTSEIVALRKLEKTMTVGGFLRKLNYIQSLGENHGRAAG